MSDPTLTDYPSNRMSAAEVEAAERMAFLRKTYSKLMIGVVLFAATISATPKVPFLAELCGKLYSFGPLILLLLLGAGFLVRVLARKFPIGMIAYLAYAVFMGLIIAPFAMVAGDHVTTQAGILTLMIFSGLTAYVFVTKKDFSFLGGALAMGLFFLMGIALISGLTGWSPGIWYSILGVLIFSGFILYDTSNILRRSRPDESLPAAIELFTDIVWLFYYVLMLFLDRE